MRHFPVDLVPHSKASLVPWNPELALDAEIGAGQGLHAIQYCKANTDRQLIAIERTENKFLKFERRAKRHPQLTNLFPVHADAVSVLTHQIPDASIARIFLLYPNPYPKAKQRNLRWHLSPSMAMLKAKLKPGGTLHLATNLSWYADEAEVAMKQIWGLRLLQRLTLRDSKQARTHFERKYLDQGQTCHDLIFQIQ